MNFLKRSTFTINRFLRELTFHLSSKSKADSKYLFILSPPYCGSTLLAQILCTSSFVSINNTRGNWEGQQIPSVRKEMFEIPTRWDESLEFNWPRILKEWRKSWDLSKPVLLEKSPPNTVRGKVISQAFQPAYFLILVRDPLAISEGLMRRNNWSAQKAADFVLKVFKHQYWNAHSLQNALTISYEDLTLNQEFISSKIIEHLPEIKELTLNKEFTAHNFKQKKMGIENLNLEKINRLSEPDLNTLKNRFNQSSEINYFGYKFS